MCEFCEDQSRRNFLKALLVGGAAAGVGMLDPKILLAQTTQIKFSTWHPPVGKEVKTVWIPMLEELKKKSGGKMAYTMYAGGALGKGPEHFDIVAKGMSDMGYFTATWTPGRFPLTDVLSLAVWVDGKDLAADIGNAVYKRILKDEFKNVKVLELNGCIQSFIWTKKPVSKMADLKGMKLRSPGGHQTNYIKALGAEPVFMPLGDVYMAMETGTVDGLVTCAPLIQGFKLYEVAKYATVLTFGCVSEGVVMNMNTWNKLPEEQKKLIDQVCTNPFKVTGGLTREVYKNELMKQIASAGVKFIDLPKSEAQQWYKRFQDVTRAWVKDLEAKKLPAKKAVAIMNEECEKRGIELVACPPEFKKV
ncbi:MAG TPA: TRAP transporter substrate-binding protein DctP [Syntrophorhabdaceae bacterium]|nr:TRAP transporter substrate-binding protein DctP [Syntrophorhabdaceae bacterium]HOL05480.1 TRAP transporter substrate-binding protein DctP [Syntrophorhabdaceae bacterium]HON86382.1 TRAP transporter substrate-binding protein DctP [Syntrophorhabdaceae bacterium]HOT41400.1 TRAP transporter substrate-binding protein DctP [Syntrophorhabdaceae bacterium]HPC66910.1 TRAP transporter substrate-binding protein DctP [Syntrophorhabdaceae bacterium]